MNDFVCIPRRFPAAGVDGVLGVPVTNLSEHDSYLSALPVPVDDGKVRFVRLTAIPERSRGHLKVDDVVVKYTGLSERFLDIIRPVKTAVYNTNFRSGEIDWDMAEEARAQALDGQRWALTNDSSQVAICDPEGNLAVLRGSYGTSRGLFKYAYSVYLDTEQDKNRIRRHRYQDHVVDPQDKPRWAWATFKFIHYWIMKNGPVVGSGHWHEFKKMVKKHHSFIQKVPTPELGNYLRLHTRRNNKGSEKFWHRVRVQYLEDPESLPRVLSFVSEKKEVRWVRIETHELEEIMKFAEWPEWSDVCDPFHFSTFRSKSMAAWN